ncbi:MAG: hypothetical protein ABL891_21510, partial [Burkholderiales bacterium]
MQLSLPLVRAAIDAPLFYAANAADYTARRAENCGVRDFFCGKLRPALLPDDAALLILEPVTFAAQVLINVGKFVAQFAALVVGLRSLQPLHFLQALFAGATIALKAVDTAPRQ